MSSNSGTIGVVLWSVTGLLAACYDPCANLEPQELKAATYQTDPRTTPREPVPGIKQKTMVYDKELNKLTITYTAANKVYVETWRLVRTAK